MIKELKKSFITLSMISIMAVMFLITLAFNIITYIQFTKSLNYANEILIENSETYLNIPINLDLMNDIPLNENLMTVRFFVVSYEKAKQGDMVIKFVPDLSDDEAVNYADRVTQKKKKRGWCREFYYSVGEVEGNTIVSFIDGSEMIIFLRNLLLISLSIWIGCSVLVLFIAFFLTTKAVHPTVLALDRQKQFITDASHELKTPLTVIAADMEVLEMSSGTNEWCEDIKMQVKEMQKLVNQIVVLAKMDEYEETIIGSKENFCISDAVYDTAKVFSSLQKAASDEFMIDIEPDIYINGEEALIRRLVSILLDNAFKYYDKKGNISISLKKQKRIKLSVTNTYENVAALNLNQLFERFYRGDRARGMNGSHGIGLAIARSIVEKHRGKISANNIDNRLFEIEIIL